VSRASIAANKNLQAPGLTTGQLIAQNQKRFGKDITSDGSTKQEDFTDNIDREIKKNLEIAEGKAKSNKEGAIAKALADAENKADKEGVELTKEKRAELIKSVGARYDAEHADEEENKRIAAAREAIGQIVGLDQQRKTLIQEINAADGDSPKVEAEKARVVEINKQINELLPKARELAKALGDEKMVAQLEKVSQSTDTINKQFSIFGLTFSQTKTLAGNFADGLVGAFDSFAQSIAQGKNAFESLRNAFLKFASDFLIQIANMILKSLILKQINSLFPGLGGVGVAAEGATAGAAAGGGGFFSSILGAFAHSGGIVGGAGVGGGNMSRSMPMAAFMNAPRYHAGGMAGFAPNEVATVLQRNEEVLTTQDPRHRWNSGGAGGASSPTIKQVLAVGESEIANAMIGSPGEQVVMTHIKRNASTLKRILA
jgi:hypothetical protein